MQKLSIQMHPSHFLGECLNHQDTGTATLMFLKYDNEKRAMVWA